MSAASSGGETVWRVIKMDERTAGAKRKQPIGRGRTWPFLFLTRAHLLLHFRLTCQIFVFPFHLFALLIINELQIALIASSLKENYLSTPD